jgi:glycolate oxidase FAD binding subunit
LTLQAHNQLTDCVQQANAAGTQLEVRGGGTLKALGGWQSSNTVADTSRLKGIIDYDPQELVLTAYAGTPLRDVEQLLADRDQMLAFEPLLLGSLFGGHEAATLGGIIASNAAGPRRVHAGTVRDHFIGFEAIAGSGEVFQAGGRVFKNVTGFDLPKLLAGSWGALAILTRVTFRVLPQPKDSITLMLRDLDAQRAVMAMLRSLRAPLEVSGCAHLPARAGGYGEALAALPGDGAATLLRLEGFAPSVKARARHLTQLLEDLGVVRPLEDGPRVWESLRQCRQLPDSPDSIWRISLPATHAAQCLEACAHLTSAWSLDWGGGLVWLVIPPDAATSNGTVAQSIHAAARRWHGHATLVRAAAASSAQAAFPELDPVHLAVQSRVKQAFDPRGVLVDRRRTALG